MAEPSGATNPPKLWRTARATRRAALIGLGLFPIILLLHPEDVRALFNLYSLGDWGSLAGTVMGYVLGAALAVAVPVALICGARNFVVGLALAERVGRFGRGVLCVIAAGIALCGLIVAVVVVALVGGKLGGPQVASLAPLIVLGGGSLIWFLRTRWRRFVAAARNL